VTFLLPLLVSGVYLAQRFARSTVRLAAGGAYYSRIDVGAKLRDRSSMVRRRRLLAPPRRPA